MTTTDRDERVSVLDVVGGPLCMASKDGRTIRDRLAAAIRNKRQVILSFKGITHLTPSFLRAAIGQLYGMFTAKRIRSFLVLEDMTDRDRAMLEEVIESIRLYFKDPKGYTRKIRKIMEDV